MGNSSEEEFHAVAFMRDLKNADKDLAVAFPLRCREDAYKRQTQTLINNITATVMKKGEFEPIVWDEFEACLSFCGGTFDGHVH